MALGKLVKSKVTSSNVMISSEGNLGLGGFGSNENAPISFKSGTKAAINPTTDNDDMKGAGPEGYGLNIAAGASGDKAMGYPWQGQGIAELNGAQGN